MLVYGYFLDGLMRVCVNCMASLRQQERNQIRSEFRNGAKLMFIMYRSTKCNTPKFTCARPFIARFLIRSVDSILMHFEEFWQWHFTANISLCWLSKQTRTHIYFDMDASDEVILLWDSSGDCGGGGGNSSSNRWLLHRIIETVAPNDMSKQY